MTAHAQDAASLFKSKCAGCHAADGTGTAMGKKMGAHDFTTADVQRYVRRAAHRDHYKRQRQDAEI